MNKKLALAAYLLAFALTPAIAQSTVTTVQTSTAARIFVRPFCRFGLQFLASSLDKTNNGNGAGGVTVTQVQGSNGFPMPCTEDLTGPTKPLGFK